MATGLFPRLDAERARWPLWLPVALGAGAALYFAFPVEPSAAIGLAALLVALGAGMAGLVTGRIALGLVAALALGFAAAKFREERVVAPVLERTLTLHLTGEVLSVDPAAKGVRLVVGNLRSGGFGANPPARVRIAVRSGGEILRAGQGVSLTARLVPPPGPSEPGDSDFARAAFFQRIGGVGFSYGAPIPAPVIQSSPLPIEGLRESMTARIRAILPGSDGAIASALITGERGGIEPSDEASLRDAGLAHVLAIAGLHMALVGGGLFWLLRALLAAIPSLALNYPIKKWAAGAALAGAAFYLLISGGTASSTRAFVMLAMMLLAILIDRPALSMRGLGLAAAILLLAWPESITEPGFQMSFAAVTALVAVAEWDQRRQRAIPHGFAYRYLRGIAVASLVGSLATMPFVIFTFDRATHYAVAGNLLAMPVMGFVVMPAAALSVMAMPFHLEAAPLHLMAWGLDIMLAMGRFVSGLPGAVTVSRAFPVEALALMSLGGLWLAIWRGEKRWWGLIPIALGTAWAVAAPSPDLLVAADARTVAIRGGDGLLYFPEKPKDNFAATRWLARDGDDRTPRDAIGGGNCDGAGCVARLPDGSLVAMPRRPEAIPDDCAHAAIIVASLPVANCKGPKLILDSRTIAAGGGYAITKEMALSVRQTRGVRPWVR